MSPKFHRFYRIIAALTFFCFFNQTAFANALPLFSLFPKNSGTIESDSSKSNSKNVILILNAHTSSDAQKNISELLKFFQSQGIDLIGLEGADEKIDGTMFRNFPYKDSLADAAWQMVKEGKFTGAEYFYITSEKLPDFFGLEDKSLYLANRDAFIQTSEAAGKLKDTLDYLNTSLFSLKKQIYSKSLFNFDQEINRYQTNNIGYLDHFSFLVNKAKEAHVSLPNFSNLYALSKTIEKEKKLSQKKLHKDLEKIKKNLTQEKIDESIFQLTEGNNSLAGTTDHIFESYQKIHAYFSALIEEKRFDPTQFKNFSAYFEYLSLFLSFDSSKMFDELNELTQLIYDRLSTNEKEKKLLGLNQSYFIFQKMISIQLTQDEWERISKSSSLRGVSKGRRSNLSFEIASLTSFARNDGHFQISESDISLIHTAESSAQHFYELAEKRNQIFANRIEQEMNRKKKDLSVVVIGGFHEKGLKTLLESRGISTSVVSPKIGNALSDIPYMDRMLNKPTLLQSILMQASTLEKALIISGIISENERLADGQEFKVRAIFSKLSQTSAVSQNLIDELGRFLSGFKIKQKNGENESGHYTLSLQGNTGSIDLNIEPSGELIARAEMRNEREAKRKIIEEEFRHRDIRIIFMDFDGTFSDSREIPTPAAFETVNRLAADHGIKIDFLSSGGLPYLQKQLVGGLKSDPKVRKQFIIAGEAGGNIGSFDENGIFHKDLERSIQVSDSEKNLAIQVLRNAVNGSPLARQLREGAQYNFRNRETSVALSVTDSKLQPFLQPLINSVKASMQTLYHQGKFSSEPYSALSNVAIDVTFSKKRNWVFKRLQELGLQLDQALVVDDSIFPNGGGRDIFELPGLMKLNAGAKRNDNPNGTLDTEIEGPEGTTLAMQLLYDVIKEKRKSSALNSLRFFYDKTFPKGIPSELTALSRRISKAIQVLAKSGPIEIAQIYEAEQLVEENQTTRAEVRAITTPEILMYGTSAIILSAAVARSVWKLIKELNDYRFYQDILARSKEGSLKDMMTSKTLRRILDGTQKYIQYQNYEDVLTRLEEGDLEEVITPETIRRILDRAQKYIQYRASSQREPKIQLPTQTGITAFEALEVFLGQIKSAPTSEDLEIFDAAMNYPYPQLNGHPDISQEFYEQVDNLFHNFFWELANNSDQQIAKEAMHLYQQFTHRAQKMDWAAIEELGPKIDAQGLNFELLLTQYLGRLYTALPASVWPQFNDLAKTLQETVRETQSSKDDIKNARQRLETFVKEHQIIRAEARAPEQFPQVEKILVLGVNEERSKELLAPLYNPKNKIFSHLIQEIIPVLVKEGLSQFVGDKDLLFVSQDYYKKNTAAIEGILKEYSSPVLIQFDDKQPLTESDLLKKIDQAFQPANLEGENKIMIRPNRSFEFIAFVEELFEISSREKIQGNQITEREFFKINKYGELITSSYDAPEALVSNPHKGKYYDIKVRSRKGATVNVIITNNSDQDVVITPFRSEARSNDLGYEIEPLPNDLLGRLPAITVRERIDEIRKVRNITKAVMLRKAGILSSTGSYLINKDIRRPGQSFFKLAQALNVDLILILKGRPLDQALSEVNLAEKMELLRLRKGWTQKKTADEFEKAGLKFISKTGRIEEKRPTITQWERGHLPSPEKWDIIAKVLGYPRLFEGVEFRGGTAYKKVPAQISSAETNYQVKVSSLERSVTAMLILAKRQQDISNVLFDDFFKAVQKTVSVAEELEKTGQLKGKVMKPAGTFRQAIEIYTKAKTLSGEEHNQLSSLENKFNVLVKRNRSEVRTDRQSSAKEKLENLEMIIRHSPEKHVDRYLQIETLLAVLYGGDVQYYESHHESKNKDKAYLWKSHRFDNLTGLLELENSQKLTSRQLKTVNTLIQEVKRKLIHLGFRIDLQVSTGRYKTIGELLTKEPYFQNPFFHLFFGRSSQLATVTTAQSRLERAIEVGGFTSEDEKYFRRFDDIFQPKIEMTGVEPFTVRTKHKGVLGPYKGGDRFVYENTIKWDDVFMERFNKLLKFRLNLIELRYFLRKWDKEGTRALAFLMTGKNAVAELPYGGAKGTILFADVFEEENGRMVIRDLFSGAYAEQNKAALERNYTRSLLEAGKVGALIDIPATDVGSRPADMARMADEVIEYVYEKAIHDKSIKNWDQQLVRDFDSVPKNTFDATVLPLYLQLTINYLNKLRKQNKTVPSWAVSLTQAVASYTSKTIESGGSVLRQEATGIGGVYDLERVAEIEGFAIDKDQPLKGLSAKLEGFGVVGRQVAVELAKRDSPVQIISEGPGGVVYKEQGFSVNELEKLAALKTRTGNLLALNKEIGENGEFAIENARLVDDAFFLSTHTNIMIIASKESSIRKKNVGQLETDIILELANGGITNEAFDELLKRNKIVIPDVLANMGGVIVSFFEWQQNLKNEHWSEDEIAHRLKEKLKEAVESVDAVRREFNTDWRTAADILMMRRILAARDKQLPKNEAPTRRAEVRNITSNLEPDEPYIVGGPIQNPTPENIEKTDQTKKSLEPLEGYRFLSDDSFDDFFGAPNTTEIELPDNLPSRAETRMFDEQKVVADLVTIARGGKSTEVKEAQERLKQLTQNRQDFSDLRGLYTRLSSQPKSYEFVIPRELRPEVIKILRKTLTTNRAEIRNFISMDIAAVGDEIRNTTEHLRYDQKLIEPIEKILQRLEFASRLSNRLREPNQNFPVQLSKILNEVSTQLPKDKIFDETRHDLERIKLRLVSNPNRRAEARASGKQWNANAQIQTLEELLNSFELLRNSSREGFKNFDISHFLAHLEHFEALLAVKLEEIKEGRETEEKNQKFVEDLIRYYERLKEVQAEVISRARANFSKLGPTKDFVTELITFNILLESAVSKFSESKRAEVRGKNQEAKRVLNSLQILYDQLTVSSKSVMGLIEGERLSNISTAIKNLKEFPTFKNIQAGKKLLDEEIASEPATFNPELPHVIAEPHEDRFVLKNLNDSQPALTANDLSGRSEARTIVDKQAIEVPLDDQPAEVIRKRAENLRAQRTIQVGSLNIEQGVLASGLSLEKAAEETATALSAQKESKSIFERLTADEIAASIDIKNERVSEAFKTFANITALGHKLIFLVPRDKEYDFKQILQQFGIRKGVSVRTYEKPTLLVQEMNMKHRYTSQVSLLTENLDEVERMSTIESVRNMKPYLIVVDRSDEKNLKVEDSLLGKARLAIEAVTLRQNVFIALKGIENGYRPDASIFSNVYATLVAINRNLKLLATQA